MGDLAWAAACMEGRCTLVVAVACSLDPHLATITAAAVLAVVGRVDTCRQLVAVAVSRWEAWAGLEEDPSMRHRAGVLNYF